METPFLFPLEVKAFLVVFLTNGIKSLLAMFKVVVQGWWAVLVAALVAGFVSFAAVLLGGADPAVQEFVIGVLTLLAGMGLYETAVTIGKRA